MFVITDYMDGRFRWSQAPDELKDLAVEVSDSTIEMWRAVAALDAIVQKQLLAIDNQTQEQALQAGEKITRDADIHNQAAQSQRPRTGRPDRRDQ